MRPYDCAIARTTGNSSTKINTMAIIQVTIWQMINLRDLYQGTGGLVDGMVLLGAPISVCEGPEVAP